jgi:hypothetical protein
MDLLSKIGFTQAIMPRFELKQSTRHLTSHAGLALLGQCFEAARLELLDAKLPTSQGMKTSDLVKSYAGLLSLGKSDFEAIEAFRSDRFFKQALKLGKVPSSVWLRQRMEQLAAPLREETDAYSLRLLQRCEAPITARNGFVCLDFDTFVMDNSGTKKEWVSRTYQGVDGYTPIAAYLGNEGWCLALELRPGSQHSALETHYFLERVLPRAQALVGPEQAVLSRSDSGFDSARLLFQQDDEKRAWAEQGRRFEYLVKWNPRKQTMTDWIARANQVQAWTETRPGKRVALLDLSVERAWQKQKRDFRLIVRLVERTLDKKGQHLLFPAYQLEGWWTSLNEPAAKVIELYREHATHEQFHSEIKSDLDLERLPSGKFDCNDLILHLAMLTYNCLRLIGQLGLTGELSPVRHPAKRRRLKTVLQEIMYRAAQFIRTARRLVLDFGRDCPVVKVFAQLQTHLLAAGQAP